ncbi:hypothetical protein [Loktanella sp. SALINAS62]|uniref:hypothetical protein n=1 Tax=Loktanella sp. SALINAS62 TaxID=2706124 RepID=UPI0020119CC8|nr:hypothetical protein [Loktanella sp. SALINAS62]
MSNLFSVAALAVSALTLVACAQTDIQPLSASSFKVATTAAPACGRSGARKVANQAAAVEVINRGGDKFIIVGDQTGSRVTGMGYNQYTGFQPYNSNEQDLVVQMMAPGQPGFDQALSARSLLGSDWQNVVASGTPATCT